MIVALTSPIRRKRGPARKPIGEVTPKTMRNRRYEDNKCLKNLVAAGIDPPCELLNIMPGINGRPRLDDSVIALDEPHLGASLPHLAGGCCCCLSQR